MSPTSIKGGDVIQVGGNVLIERVQTAGPGQVNLSPERIYELGNYLSVATIYDIPDLTFTLDSLDATAQFEAILAGVPYTGRATTGTASGSSTVTPTHITDTAGAFTAADVGTGFTLAGAGAAGATLIGTITTVTDSTHIIVSTPVLTTVSAADATYNFLAPGQAINLAAALPLDILSEIKNGQTAASPFNVAGSVVIPFLTMEGVNYDFGVKVNAKQNASLKGDSLFYNPAGSSAYLQTAVGTNTANQTIVLTHNAYPYNGAVLDGTKYVLAARLASGKRLFFGTDYTEAVTGAGTTKAVTVTILAAVPTTDKIVLIYASDTVAAYAQSVHTLDGAATPAAIRGKDIEVFVNGVTLADRWTDVQQFTGSFKVTLDQDREFSNSQLVDQDFFVPDVSGTVVVKPRDYAALYKKIAAAAGLATTNEVAGALTTVSVALTIVLHSPVDGSALKTIYVADARFTMPAFSATVQQKTSVTFPWSSDTGAMLVYRGAKP